MLNRDGSFNVRRTGFSFFRSLNLYHHLLTLSWPSFYLMLASSYVIFNILFAIGYVLCEPGALRGSTATTIPDKLLEAFFFSLQTSTTIGYGHLVPWGVAANILVSLQAMTALLGFALATAILFARFSRPTPQILFSDTAIVAPYKGITALEFRLANLKSTQLINVSANVILSRTESVGGVSVRKFHTLALEREQVVFFPLNWTVVHPIDRDSPLAGVSREVFYESDPEILILLMAIDETFSETVHVRTSYKSREIVWGAKFGDMFDRSAGDSLAVDLRRLHVTEPAELPA